MGEMVSFASNGGTSEGYLALPAGGVGPGVIVIQEWWGLVGHITSVADRFAAEGFVALAPDLYHGAHTGEPDEAQRLLMGLAMDQAASFVMRRFPASQSASPSITPSQCRQPRRSSAGPGGCIKRAWAIS